MMRRLYTGALIVIAVLLVVMYYRYDPSLYTFFPKCPFHCLTGLACPGCGSQRAVHAILNGDIGAAVQHNLLLVASVPFLLVHADFKLKSFLTKKETAWSLVGHPVTPVVILVVVIAFWILRNISAGPFTVLSPAY